MDIIREKVVVIITGHPRSLACNERDADDVFGFGFCRCAYHYLNKPGYPLYIIDLDKNELLEDQHSLEYELCPAQATEFLLPPGTKGLPKVTDNGVIFQVKDEFGGGNKIVHKYFADRVWQSLDIPSKMFSCQRSGEDDSD